MGKILWAIALLAALIAPANAEPIDPILWENPTQNVDGTPLTDLETIRFYRGQSSRGYTAFEDVSPTPTIYTIDPGCGDWFFTATAWNAQGEESAYSQEIRRNAGSCDPPPPPISGPGPATLIADYSFLPRPPNTGPPATMSEIIEGVERTGGNQSGQSSSSFTFTTAPAEGDVILFTFGLNNGPQSYSNMTSAQGASFITRIDAHDGNNDFTGGIGNVFAKIAGASEPTTYTFSHGGIRITGYAMVIRGTGITHVAQIGAYLNESEDVEVTSLATPASGTIDVANGDLLIQLASVSSETPTMESGWTADYAENASGASLNISSLEVTADGTDSATATVGTAAEMAGILFHFPVAEPDGAHHFQTLRFDSSALAPVVPIGTPFEGDLMVMTINVFSDATVTTPTGWALLHGVQGSFGGGGVGRYVFSKVAGASEPTTVTVTTSSTAAKAFIVSTFANAAGVRDSAISGEVNTGFTVDAPAVSAVAGDLVVEHALSLGFTASGHSLSFATTNGEYAPLDELGDDPNNSQAMQAALFEATGASSANTWTNQTTDRNMMAATIAIASTPIAPAGVVVQAISTGWGGSPRTATLTTPPAIGDHFVFTLLVPGWVTWTDIVVTDDAGNTYTLDYSGDIGSNAFVYSAPILAVPSTISVAFTGGSESLYAIGHTIQGTLTASPFLEGFAKTDRPWASSWSWSPVTTNDNSVLVGVFEGETTSAYLGDYSYVEPGLGLAHSAVYQTDAGAAGAEIMGGTLDADGFEPRALLVAYDYGQSGGAGGVSASVDQASDTETAQAITPVQPVSIAQVTQTDTAQGVTSSKARAFLQSTDTETAQAIAASKAQALETASEAGTANTIGKGKAKAAETALQSDTAQGITPQVPNELNQASDTETAQVLTPIQPSTIAQASDTETAQGFTSAKALGFLQSTDTETAQTVTPILLHVLEQATDNETAQAITSAKALGFLQAQDTQSANAITYAVPTSYIPADRYLLVPARIRSIKAANRIRSIKP